MTDDVAGLIPKAIWTAAVMALSMTCSVAATAADATNGLNLAGKWCNSCHSIGTEEPRQEDAGPLFTDLAKKDSDYLMIAINRPHDFMPKFPRLTEADKSDLIAYIRSLK